MHVAAGAIECRDQLSANLLPLAVAKRVALASLPHKVVPTSFSAR